MEKIRLISRAAGELKCRVFIVGGFVRDLIMDVKDFDLDITSEKDGIALAERLNRDFNGSFSQHKRFGTASIVLPDKSKLDVATSRKEMYETPASLPKVFPGSIRDDLARRDFSINAIAVDVSRGWIRPGDRFLSGPSGHPKQDYPRFARFKFY